MQIQKPKKALAFVLGLGILFLGGEISVSNLSADLSAMEVLEITGFKNLASEPKVDDEISIVGQNFGNKAADLKVNLNGTDYSVVSSYGNELKFKLTSSLQSGNLFVKKTVTVDETNETLESNQIYLDLKTPKITKSEAINGLLPHNDLTIYGVNFGLAEFFCGTEGLKIKSAEPDSITIELPEKFLDCSIITKKSGFEIDTKNTLFIMAPVELSGISLVEDTFKVYGKGFTNYQSDLAKLSLVFSDGRSSLSNPTFVADGEINFAKNSTLLPHSGRVALKIDTISTPQFDYNANGDFPSITEITDLQAQLDGKINYQLNWNGSLDRRSEMKFKVNSNEVSLTGNQVEADSPPSQTGTAWVEMDDWKSQVLNYEFTETLVPKITEIKIGNYLNFEILGKNFGSRETLLSVSTGAGSFGVIQAQDTLVTIATVSGSDDDKDTEYVTPEGDFTLTIKNEWGTSNSIDFTLPAEKDQTFYAKPIVTGIEAVDGLARGRKFWILGDNFLNAATANFGGTVVAVKILSTTKVEAVPPANIPLTGKLSVSDQAGNTSAEINYALIPTNQLKPITFEFPLETEGTILQNDEWQNLFAFSVQNNQKPIELDSVEFNFEGEISQLSLVDFQLVDAEGQKITDTEIELSQSGKQIRLRNIPVSVAAEKIVFTVQTKIFRQLATDKVFSFEVGNLFEKDSTSITRENSQKKITLTAAEPAAKWCRETSGDEWQECRKRVRRSTSIPR